MRGSHGCATSSTRATSSRSRQRLRSSHATGSNGCSPWLSSELMESRADAVREIARYVPRANDAQRERQSSK